MINDPTMFNEYEKNILYNFFTRRSYMEEVYKKNQQYFSLNKDKNVVIWGCGIFGKKILNYLKKFNIVPKYIIDKNESLYGTQVDNILITSFENVKEGCDIIIVSIKDYNIFKDIKEIINSSGAKIEVKYYEDLFEI
jgi:NADH/NAD ratio-sensing transcriptional regulator Rex